MNWGAWNTCEKCGTHKPEHAQCAVCGDIKKTPADLRNKRDFVERFVMSPMAVAILGSRAGVAEWQGLSNTDLVLKHADAIYRAIERHFSEEGE